MILDKEVENEIATTMAYKRLFGTPDGEVVLEHLKKVSCFYTSTVLQEEIRDLAQWREGRRSVVLDIISHMNRDIEEFRKLIVEQKRQEEENSDDYA